MPKRALQPAEMPLDSPGGELQCIGQFQSTVTYKGKTHPLTAYVIRGPVISSESTTPRSFVIRTQRGAELRRNRRHLQPGPVPQPIPAAHRDVTGLGD
ncbi:unnamed protein product [Boreogadus saida]